MNIAEWNATRLATHSCVSKSVHVARGTLRRCTESRRYHSCGGRVDARDPFRELVGMLAGPRLLGGGGVFFFFLRCRNLSTTPFVFGDSAYSDTGHREATSRGTRSNFRGSTKLRCCPAGISTREKGRVPPGHCT